MSVLSCPVLSCPVLSCPGGCTQGSWRLFDQMRALNWNIMNQSVCYLVGIKKAKWKQKAKKLNSFRYLGCHYIEEITNLIRIFPMNCFKRYKLQQCAPLPRSFRVNTSWSKYCDSIQFEQRNLIEFLTQFLGESSFANIFQCTEFPTPSCTSQNNCSRRKQVEVKCS